MSISRLFVLILLFTTTVARADLILRGFIPDQPRADQPIKIRYDLLWGPNRATCEGIRDDIPPVFSVQGNLILARFPVSVQPNSVLMIGCQNVFNFIGLTWTTTQTFPAGNYTFRFIASPALLGPGSGPFIPEVIVGDLPLTVLPALGGTVTAIPIMNGVGMFILCFLLCGAALFGFSRSKKIASTLSLLMLFSVVHAQPIQADLRPRTLVVELKENVDVQALLVQFRNNPLADVALNAGLPVSIRPAGGPIFNSDQLAILRNKPNHPFRRQMRTLVIEYPKRKSGTPAVSKSS